MNLTKNSNMKNNMKIYFKYIKYVCLIYILAIFIFIVLYTFIRWIITIKYPLIDISEDYFIMYIPCVLGIIMYFFFKKILKKLNYENKDNKEFLLAFLSLTIFVSNLTVQINLTYKTYDIINLNGIENLKKGVRYCKIKDYHINKKQLLRYEVIDCSGSKKSTSFNIYYLFPFINRSNTFFVVNYIKRVSNYQTDEKERVEIFNHFRSQCNIDINYYNFFVNKNFEILPNSYKKDVLIKNLKIKPNSYLLVPLELNQYYNTDVFNEIIVFIIVGFVIIILNLLKLDFENDRK